MTTPLTQKRIEWIDCAKGISILLVVLGHSVNGILRGAIFSFHMPLFFVMSCLTYRMSTDMGQLWRKTKKAFVHLVIPALLLFVLTILGEAIIDRTFMDLEFWKAKAWSLLFASGSQFYIGDLHIQRMGIPWFLIVLFTGRTLFDLLHLKLGKAFIPVCVVLSMVGVVIGQTLQLWLPLSLDVMLASLIFLLFGLWLRKWNFEVCPWICLITVTALWAVTLLFTEWMDMKYLEMSMRRYPLYPLCLITALAGTMMVSQFSSLLVRYLGWLKKPLVFLGEHSLDMLCVHTMDFLWEPVYMVSSKMLVCAFIRLTVDLVAFIAFVYAKKLIKERFK